MIRMIRSTALLGALVALSACNDPLAPIPEPEDVRPYEGPLLPSLDQTRPFGGGGSDLKADCSLPHHNSGKCGALWATVLGTTGAMGGACTAAASTKDPSKIGVCMGAIGAAARAWEEWDQGLDAFGHRGWEPGMAWTDEDLQRGRDEGRSDSWF
jgi:hypothetical protein